jgi:hypothetical protein
MTWLARPMMYLPYILRALRLRQIWDVHQDQLKSQVGQVSNKQPSIYFIKEKNLIKWLLVVLIPLGALTLLTTVVPEFTNLLPYLYISQCNTKVGKDYYTEINSAMFTFCIS